MISRWFYSPYYDDNYTTNKDASWIWVLYNWAMDWQSPLVLVNLAGDVLRFTHILYNWDLTHVDFKLVSNFQNSFDIYLPYSNDLLIIILILYLLLGLDDNTFREVMLFGLDENGPL